MNELINACKENCLRPFPNINRLQMDPPGNIGKADGHLGIALLDKSLAAIAKYYQE